MNPNKEEGAYDSQSNKCAGLKNENEGNVDDTAIQEGPNEPPPSMMHRFKNEDEDMNDDTDEGYIVMKKNESMETDDTTLHLEDGDTVEVAEPPPLPPLRLEPPPMADVVSNPELLALFMNELRTITRASGCYLSITKMNDAIHYEKAQNILEATAGDVLTAAQLYWDDYLATLQEQEEQHIQQRQQQPEESKNPADEGLSNDRTNVERQREKLRSPPPPPEPEVDVDRTSVTSNNRRRHRRGKDPDALDVADMNPYHFLRQQHPPPPPLPEGGQPEDPAINQHNVSHAQRLLQQEKNKDKEVPWEFANYRFRRQDRNRMKNLVQQRRIVKTQEQERGNRFSDVYNPYETNNNTSSANRSNLHLQQLLFDMHCQQRQQDRDGNRNDNDSAPSAGLEQPPIHNDADALRLFSRGKNDDADSSDDDNDDIIVRRSSVNSNNSKHRLLQFLRDSNLDKKNEIPIVDPVSVKRRKLTQTNKIKKTNDDDESIDSSDDDDEDDYLSDNDWMWESLANMSSWADLSPISLPMDLLWGGSHSIAAGGAISSETNATAAATEASTNSYRTISPKIIETKVTDNHGRTRRIVKISAQHYQEKVRNSANGRKPKNNSLPSADDIEPSSSLVPSIVDDTAENGKPMDEENNDDKDDDGKAAKIDEVVAGIPRTWMSAGFHLVKTELTGTSDIADAAATTTAPDKSSVGGSESPKIIGLAVLPPNENDFAYNMWKNQQTENDARHATIPLPYHCRSITALLSIVTGVMYTGATVESGGHVSCTSSRPPLQEVVIEENMKTKKNPKVKLSKGELMYRELSETDRLSREYESRLVDALTALLRIAAEASMKRKTKALQVLQTSKDPTDQRRWLLIKRKLRLVPTCWWEVPLNEIRLIHTAMPKDDLCCLPIVVSYTNIQDLRSYVQGNIRAFTTTGGCALFLETIARIHGKGALSHMIRRSRKAAGYTGADVSIPLLCCKCTHRHYNTLDEDPVLAKTLKAQCKKGIQIDTTPPVHSCLSTELLSLLLVGRVHSTLQGWSTSPLGLGILSNTMNEVGRGLTRPEKPVWILRGPTCYSVMWLNGCSDHVDTFARMDHSGTVASMTHWNCWHSVRNATQLRLVTDRSNTVISGSSTYEYTDDGDSNKINFACHMLHRRSANEHSARERDQIEQIDPSLFVSNKDMECVTLHPDDPSYYPNLYRMWRYDMSEELTNDDDDDQNIGNDESKTRKPHVPIWKSYHSLNDHEKHVIETKLGPQICTVLWTRWPRATVDRLVPNDVPPIV